MSAPSRSQLKSMMHVQQLISKITLDSHPLTIEVPMPTILCPPTLSDVDSLWPTIAYTCFLLNVLKCALST